MFDQFIEGMRTVDPSTLFGIIIVILIFALIIKAVKKATKVAIIVLLSIAVYLIATKEFTMSQSQNDIGITTKIVRELATEEPGLLKTDSSDGVEIYVRNQWVDLDDIEFVKWYRLQCIIITDDNDIEVDSYKLKMLLASKFREVFKYE